MCNPDARSRRNSTLNSRDTTRHDVSNEISEHVGEDWGRGRRMEEVDTRVIAFAPRLLRYVHVVVQSGRASKVFGLSKLSPMGLGGVIRISVYRGF